MADVMMPEAARARAPVVGMGIRMGSDEQGSSAAGTRAWRRSRWRRKLPVRVAPVEAARDQREPRWIGHALLGRGAVDSFVDMCQSKAFQATAALCFTGIIVLEVCDITKTTHHKRARCGLPRQHQAGTRADDVAVLGQLPRA